MVGPRGQAARLAPAPGEEAQGTRGGDRGIELAQRARGGVARIGEGLAALFGLPLIERGEIGVAHIDLAANLEDFGHVAALKLARNVRDGANVSGDVLALAAVAARGGNHQAPSLVAQRYRKAVDFHLGGDIERRAGVELQEAPHAANEIARLFIGEDVAERQHAHRVADLGEFRGRRGADLLRRAFRAGQAWKALLQHLDTLPQPVIVRIGDFRLVFLVIKLVMPLQLGRQKLVLGLGLGGGQFLHRLRLRALEGGIVLHYRTCGRDILGHNPSPCPSPPGRGDACNSARSVQAVPSPRGRGTG